MTVWLDTPAAAAMPASATWSYSRSENSSSAASMMRRSVSAAAPARARIVYGRRPYFMLIPRTRDSAASQAAAVTTVSRMDYEHTISEVVKVVEAVGAGIMVLGGLWALVLFVPRALKADGIERPYDELRRNLGRAILLGLEVLIVADIVRTIIVDPTLESVAVLGGIVIIRILLSFSLEVEMDGVWPWRRWQLTGGRSRPGAETQNRS